MEVFQTNEGYKRRFIDEILKKEMKENTQYKVNIVGYITSLDNWNNKKTFYIDDSTGLLCCIYWINDFNEDIELQLGQKIGILGTVSIYNNFRQVKVYKTYPCSSLMECYFILNRINDASLENS